MTGCTGFGAPGFEGLAVIQKGMTHEQWKAFERKAFEREALKRRCVSTRLYRGPTLATAADRLVQAGAGWCRRSAAAAVGLTQLIPQGPLGFRV